MKIPRTILVLALSVITFGCGDRLSLEMDDYAFLCGEDREAGITFLPADQNGLTPEPEKLSSVIGFDNLDTRQEVTVSPTRNGCLKLRKRNPAVVSYLLRYGEENGIALGSLFTPKTIEEADEQIQRVELQPIDAYQFESVLRCGDSNLAEAANIVNLKLVGFKGSEGAGGYSGSLVDQTGNKQSIIFNSNNCASIPRDLIGTLEVDAENLYVKKTVDYSDVVPHSLMEIKVDPPLSDKIRCEKRGYQWKWENQTCVIKSFLDFCSEIDGDRDQRKTVDELLKIVGTSDCMLANDYLASIKELDLRNKNISSLYPIYYFNQLEILQAANNSIEDLQPLAKMTNLQKLALDANRIGSVRHLPPAKGLKVLGLFRNRIRDISQFENLDYPVITDLSLGENDLSDASALKKFTSLRELYIQTNQIVSAEFLRNMSGLRILWIGGNRIEDIAPLSSLVNLTSLFISTNRISDLKPISSMTELVNLGVSDCLVTDVSPLKNLTKLRYLILWRNKIKDISPLGNMLEMTDLSIGDNPIENIEPLRIMSKMRELKMDNALISDISPLAVMKDLSILKIGGNRITDLSPLKDLPNISIFESTPNPVFNDIGSSLQTACPADAASAAVRNACKR